ncbi:hypothetical protein BU16DRAFT_166449 [Lophium mytilinum]|uniref:Uncharacterized protein n=1 Tax=Lophium mytilinum TaxID=390894 RepID=A0A6A6QCR6_9PEZI|nr:hypothetical protein BU16DRAFT_166449 [Lophium mytilinum]
MLSLRKSLLLALPFVALVLAQASPEPIPEPSETKDVNVDQNKVFQELLNALPEESLHAALHNHHPKFKDGVWEHDRTAVERVHRENPSLATRLISAAKVDLMRRQAGNATAPPASSTPAPAAPTSTAPPAVVIPVSITTTDAAGKTIVESSSVLSAPTVSVAVAVTTTNAAGETIVKTTPAPGVVLTKTDAAGSKFVTTSAVGFAHTPGQVLTETNSRGSTFVTTYTPAGGLVSSIVLITTTGKNGQPVTLTSYAFVGAGATSTKTVGAGEQTGTNTGKPGLQTGAAGVLSRQWGVEAAAVIGGAVGMAWMI